MFNLLLSLAVALTIAVPTGKVQSGNTVACPPCVCCQTQTKCCDGGCGTKVCCKHHCCKAGGCCDAGGCGGCGSCCGK